MLQGYWSYKLCFQAKDILLLKQLLSLFKFWEVLLILPFKFLFVHYILDVDVFSGFSTWLYSYLLTWESSLSFSPVGDLLALITCILGNNYLAIYLQTPAAYWIFKARIRLSHFNQNLSSSICDQVPHPPPAPHRPYPNSQVMFLPSVRTPLGWFS